MGRVDRVGVFLEDLEGDLAVEEQRLEVFRGLADRLLAEGAVKPGAMKAVRVHMIADDPLMNELSVATKTVPLPTVLADLKAAGRRAAGRFLADHKTDLGKRQTVDLVAMFG